MSSFLELTAVGGREDKYYHEHLLNFLGQGNFPKAVQLEGGRL